MYNLQYWALQTVAMLVTALLIPGLKVSGPLSAFIAVVALALLNTYLWDAALFFQIPDSLSLHALALLVVNGVIFWIVAKLLPGVEIEGILPAIAAPVVFTICSLLIQRYGRSIEWHKVFEETVALFKSVRSYFESSSEPDGERSLISKLCAWV